MMKQLRSRVSLAIAIGLGGASLALVATPAHATVWNVSNESQLQSALSSAGNGDVIELLPSVTITLTADLPILDAVTDVTINGNGAVIDGAASWDGLVVTDSVVAINSLTLQDTAHDGIELADSSGSLTNVNSRANGRSGIDVSATSLANDLEFTNVAAIENASYGLVGELEDTNLSIVDSNFSENDGGGIDFTGENAVFTASNVTANNNSSGYGMHVETSHAAGTRAIEVSNITVNDNPIGVLLSLDGAAEGVVDGVTAARNALTDLAFGAEGSATLRVSNVTSTDAAQYGAVVTALGSARLELVEATVQGAASTGLYVEDLGNSGGTDTANITVRASTFDGNEIGVQFDAYAQTEFDLLSSTVSNNSLGGISANAHDEAAVSVRNSTVAGNGANDESLGNYIRAHASSNEIDLANSTFADTRGTQTGTMVVGPAGWTGLTIQNSIFSGTTGGGVDLEIENTIIATSEIDSTLVEDPGANVQAALLNGSGNIVDASPDLGPLQDNGGPTLTMLPNDASPVINAGNDALTALPDDQRGEGFERVSGVQIDMGAVEFQAPDITSEAMPDGTVGEEYTFDASGLGEGTLTWAANGLPPGLSIDPNTGIVSGTPERSGTFEVTLTLTNAAGSDTVTLQLVIEAPTVDPDELAPTGAVSLAGLPWFFGGVLLLAAAGALGARRARALRHLR